jgi:hypothetical protein
MSFIYLLSILLWPPAGLHDSRQKKTSIATESRLKVLLLVILVLSCPSHAFSETTVTVQPNGSSGLSLSVSEMQMITQGEVRLDYQSVDQTAPVASAIGLGAQVGLQVVTESPGTIVFSFTGSKPLNGNGLLANIKLGDGVQVLALSALFRNDKGVEANARTSIINSKDNELKDPDPPDAASLKEKTSKSTRKETPGPEKPGPVAFHRLESVLDRFRTYAGERTSAAFARLFAPLADNRFIQTPAVLIADGAAGLSFTVRLTREGESVKLFLIKGAQCIASKMDEPGEWILELIPGRGKMEAGVTVQTNMETVEYPLTVAPGPADYLPVESGKDQAYILDYIKTANELAEITSASANHLPGARGR